MPDRPFCVSALGVRTTPGPGSCKAYTTSSFSLARIQGILLTARAAGMVGDCAGAEILPEARMPIKLEKRRHVAWITIDNPRKANILDRETSEELSRAWEEVWEDRAVRAAVITGSGDRHFCAGHNLDALSGLTPDDRERYTIERLIWPPAGTVNGTRIGADGRMGDHFPQIWKPVVAAVNGWAAGAGFYLLLASTDIRIASDKSRYLLAMTSRGAVGAGPGATLLMRQLRYADAMRILLTDEPVGAQEALRVGIVNEVVPHDDLLSRAEEVTDRLAAMPPVAVRMMKELAIRFRDVPTDAAWQVQHLMNSFITATTTDVDEARDAFSEKRQANFTGGLRRRGDPFPELSEEEQARFQETLRSHGIPRP